MLNKQQIAVKREDYTILQKKRELFEKVRNKNGKYLVKTKKKKKCN